MGEYLRHTCYFCGKFTQTGLIFTLFQKWPLRSKPIGHKELHKHPCFPQTLYERKGHDEMSETEHRTFAN